MFNITSAWKSAFPGAHAGVLVMRNASNPAHHDELEKQKMELEERLRSQFAGQDRAALASHPVLQIYGEYYKRFKKTYHVQLQLESILLKGKTIPSVAGLVESMFMAEVKNMLLTAGHNLDVLQLPLTLDVTTGNESYMLLRGENQTVKAGEYEDQRWHWDDLEYYLRPRPADADHRRYAQCDIYCLRSQWD